MKRVFLILTVILFWSFSIASAEDISVTASQRSVSLNDSFTLIFSSQKSFKEQPDFSPLQKDFEILSNSQEHNTSIINGSVSKQTRWKLVLMAKREGDLTIPSIQFGSSISPSLGVQVKSASKMHHEDSIFLETDISPSEWAYEQTVLIYTIRLYTTLTIAQASMSELKVSDEEAFIEQLGEDTEHEHYSSSGKYYKVIERRYTVIPQQSGELIFSPIVFEGRVLSGRNSFFDMQGHFKRISSDQHKLTIKPIPSEFQRSNWLGADDVKLSEEWSADPSKMVAGEPITWTLKVEAVGSLGSQIPDIRFNLPDTLKHYLDKPEVSTQENASGLVGTKQVKIALIGTKPGDFELPEIVLKWWDLKENHLREEIIPKRFIHIQSDVIAIASPTLSRDNASLNPELVNGQKGNEQPALPEKYDSLPLWVWGLIGINGCFLFYFFVFSCKKILIGRSNGSVAIKSDSFSQIKELLRKACKENDPKKAESILIEWASYLFPESKLLNIKLIKPLMSEEAQAALDQLYCALYGNAPSWNGENLWLSLKNIKPQRIKNKKKEERFSILKELYPND